MALFIIDFEKTIANGPVYFLLANDSHNHPKHFADQDEHWKIAKRVEVVGTAERWKAVIENMIKNGHQLAIVSFTHDNYAHVMMQYLRDIIHVQADVLTQVEFKTTMPISLAFDNKNIMIAELAMKHSYDMDKSNVYFVDFHQKNTNAAKLEGYQVIVSNPLTLSHLQELELAVSKLSGKVRKSPLMANMLMSDRASDIPEVEMGDKQVAQCHM